jgi:hypothetical protein
VKNRMLLSYAAAASAAAALLAAEPARALDCADLPDPLYLQVGDTQEPLMKHLGQQLRESAAHPMTLVYLTAGSCTNIDAFYNDTKLTQNPRYIPSAAEDPAWDPSKPAPQCTIDPAGVPLDVVNSALFVSSCTQAAPPGGVGLFQGPVQGYVFVVPEASSQKAITAEEGYFAFGFGTAGMAEPWVDESFLFIRPVTKSTLLTLAAYVGVPGAKWKGAPFDKSTEVVNAVTMSVSPEKTIGILGVEIYDQTRDKLNALAFRAFDQKYAYYPDSTATSIDKKNIRDGHYVPWSPTVWITDVDGNGVATNPDAGYFIDLILGNEVSPRPELDSLDTVIERGLIPDCAMKVTRSFDGGDLSLYDPKEPCHCFYESKVGVNSPECKTCVDDGACGGGKCRHGFCEKQ